jgi:hypothetical protein
LDSDVSGIFDDLLKADLIELPEMKRPAEAGKTDDPKYCKYHRLVGHPIHDCFIFKEKVMELAHQGKITLEDDSANVNTVTLNDHPNGVTEIDSSPNEAGCFHQKSQEHVEDCLTAMVFTDEDLMLGSQPHNRPLFVTGYLHEQRINRILVDGGSAVNILPLRTLRELEIPTNELSNSRLMIQGFNQGGQRALGTIRMELLIDDMESAALFHVIDAKTSYNLLLGRPWLHENGVGPST